MARYEALISTDWQTAGLANVAVMRFTGEGRAIGAVFLVDTFCLGVKDAVLMDDLTKAELRATMADHFPPGSMEPVDPAVAKKLIEGAVAYAEDLGFAPARDYRKARRVLGGIDTGTCAGEFTYGEQGRPHYIQGHGDDQARMARVRAILDARLGSDGYAFTTLAELDDDENDDEDDDEDGDGDADGDGGMEKDAGQDDNGGRPAKAMWQMLEDILGYCLDAPGAAELGGLIMGMVAGSDRLSVADLPRAFDQPGMFAPMEKKNKKPIDFALKAYWEEIAGIVSEITGAADNDKSWPFDFRPDDFKESVHIFLAMSNWARGFLRAGEAFSMAWGGAAARDECAGHWDVIKTWGDPERLRQVLIAKESGAGLQAKDRSLDLPSALSAVIRAAARDKG
jgi:hypothetical protein